MNQETKTLILGAGASRDVLYLPGSSLPSPLDSDFFELLQRLHPAKADAKAVRFVIQAALKNSTDALWRSMERMFYTLHLRATLEEMLFPREAQGEVEKVLDKFTRAILALLRAAHGTKASFSHEKAFRKLGGDDAIITFNYDLVPERALKLIHEGNVDFGPWVYSFGRRPSGSENVPILLKLHGSVNWIAEPAGSSFRIRQKTWNAFDSQPGYRAKGPIFPILLPEWDKKVGNPPWVDIWRRAAAHLRKTTTLIVWGYSLPLTDLKALELFKLTVGSGEPTLKKVAVIDPDKEVRDRWRSLFLRQQFWQYDRMKALLDDPRGKVLWG